MLTKEQFQACFPELSSVRISELYDSLVATLGKYDIATPIRTACFLATVGHESGNFASTSENLNYSAHALRAVFGKYFPSDVLALQYERHPQAIANRVYANRMGNGDEKSGDGWTYRGSGFIQITGRNNIGRYALSIGKPIAEAVNYMKTVPGAFDSAGWYWTDNKLNVLADQEKFVAIQGLVNVGRSTATESEINNIVDRKVRYNKVRKALGLA